MGVQDAAAAARSESKLLIPLAESASALHELGWRLFLVKKIEEYQTIRILRLATYKILL